MSNDCLWTEQNEEKKYWNELIPIFIDESTSLGESNRVGFTFIGQKQITFFEFLRSSFFFVPQKFKGYILFYLYSYDKW